MEQKKDIILTVSQSQMLDYVRKKPDVMLYMDKLTTGQGKSIIVNHYINELRSKLRKAERNRDDLLIMLESSAKSMLKQANQIRAEIKNG